MDVFQAIAEPRRRQIVELLALRGALAVSAIVLALGVPQPAVSKHLGVLREVGLVSVTQQGKQRIYTLNPEELKAVQAWIQSFERLWSGQANRIKQRAERLAATNNSGPPSGPSAPSDPDTPPGASHSC